MGFINDYLLFSQFQAKMWVQKRVSFVLPLFHFMLVERLALYDFSYAYEFSAHMFIAATPSLRPQWLSLYYPLSGNVWLAVISTIMIVPLFILLVSSHNFLIIIST